MIRATKRSITQVLDGRQFDPLRPHATPLIDPDLLGALGVTRSLRPTPTNVVACRTFAIQSGALDNPVRQGVRLILERAATPPSARSSLPKLRPLRSGVNQPVEVSIDLTTRDLNCESTRRFRLEVMRLLHHRSVPTRQHPFRLFVALLQHDIGEHQRMIDDQHMRGVGALPRAKIGAAIKVAALRTGALVGVGVGFIPHPTSGRLIKILPAAVVVVVRPRLESPEVLLLPYSTFNAG